MAHLYLIPLTSSQILTPSEKDLVLTRRNCFNIQRAIKLIGIEVPEPKRDIPNLVSHIKEELKSFSEYGTNLETLFLIWVLRPYCRDKALHATAQRISVLAYYLACNGYLFSCLKQNDSCVDSLYRCCEDFTQWVTEHSSISNMLSLMVTINEFPLWSPLYKESIAGAVFKGCSSISLKELAPLTDSQRRCKDLQAAALLQMSMDSVSLMFARKSCPVNKPYTEYPSLEHFIDPEYFDMSRNILCGLFTWAFRNFREEVDFSAAMQDITTFCYYLACNKYVLHVDKEQPELINMLANYNAGATVYKTGILVAIENIIQLRRCEVTETDYVIPYDLIQHLNKFTNAEAILTEVCRLSMLSPDYLRKEDTMKSVINAWNNLN